MTHAAPKNRRGNPQFGVDVEDFSARQRPVVVLSVKHERGSTKVKVTTWNNDFLKHLGGHWRGKAAP